QTGMNFIANTVGQEVGSQVVAGLERYVSAPSRAVEVGGKGQRDRAAELGLTEAFAGIDSGKLNPDIRTADLGGWQLGPNQAYDVLTKEEFDAAVFANDGMVPAEWIGNAGIGGSVVITPDSGGVRGYTPSGAMIDEAGNVSYRISQGDNLSTIAQGIGSSVEELAAYNNIDDPNIIIAGNVIRKPPAGFKIDRSSQVAMHSDFELVEQQTVTINNAVSDARQSPEKLDFQSVTATGESINDRLVRMGGVSANVTGVHRGIYGSYRAGFFKSLAGEVGLGGFFDDIQDQADIEAYRETLVPGTTIKTGDVFDYSLRTAEVLSVVKALPSLAKSIRNWGSVVPDSIRETGARQILDPNSARAWEELADIQYDAIRANGSDITKIAENTGWAESRIARIKDHVFFKEHQLSSGVRRFDSDVDMANAWNRLETGDFVKSDIDLLRHEIFEAKFEGIFKTDYVKAHEATISPRVNRTWTPE
ncbi:MAG: LysM domain-containing protein, partial [Sedimenticola sp.]